MENTDFTKLKKNSFEKFSSQHSGNITISKLEGRIATLNSICKDLNPYVEIPSEIKSKLKEFHIIDLYDPFSVTNKLLVLLEDSIEELARLKN